MLPVSHVEPRWIFFAAGTVLFAARIHAVKGFYLVTYGLAIALTNNLVGLLNPKARDPDALSLRAPLIQPPGGERARDPPTQPTNRFSRWAKGWDNSPRHLPEFPCWVSSQKLLLGAFCMTFVPLFDIPVFWPILLAYFVFLLIASTWQAWRRRRRFFQRRSWVL